MREVVSWGDDLLSEIRPDKRGGLLSCKMGVGGGGWLLYYFLGLHTNSTKNEISAHKKCGVISQKFHNICDFTDI